MFRIVGTESFSRELMLDVERVCGLPVFPDGGVWPAAGAEAVGAADQHVGGVSLGQHADVVLALVLKEEEKRKVSISSKVIK